jgi:flagellar basal body L-ring protein FlgH
MTSSNALARRTLAVTALFAALALTGCAAESDDPESNTGDSVSAETTAEPEPTEEPSPSAADGTDYAACDDGSCEVLVSGEVEFEFDDLTLTLTIDEDSIETYTANSDSTRAGSSSMGGSGMSDSYCVAYLTAGSNTMQCYPDIEPEEAPVPEAEPGVLVLEMLDFSEGNAVIRLTMGD